MWLNFSKNLLFISISILLMQAKIICQQLNYSSDFKSVQTINYLLQQSNSVYFSAAKPINKSYLALLNISDSILNKPERDNKYLAKHKANWIYRKLRKEDFIDFKTEGFRLRINPLFQLEYKKQQNNNEVFYINTRGIEFKGDIGKKFSFYSAFYENQARFVNYISDYVLEHRIVPGQGAAKILENNKYDYSRASAYLSISPVSFVNIQVGHSKHFIGEGYRSLLLSDNSFNYPFLKYSIDFGQFRYMILWSQHELFEGAYYSYHNRKLSSINMLSWSPAAGFEIALFEAVIWPGNTPDKSNNFTANFFNPMIMFRTFQYGLKSDKNVVLGLNIKKNIGKFEQFYAQFVLDELKVDNTGKNKYGFQLGIKSFNLFRNKLKQQNLFILAEYNHILPYTYSHTNSLQSYSHYNQSIAHPAGAGLQEFVGIVNYNFRDLFIELKMNKLTNSLDTLNTNSGSNIFLTDNGTGGTKIGQGVKNITNNIYASFGLIINPVTNMKIYIEIQKRMVNNEINKQDKMFYSIGLKTDINNYYYDY